MAVVFGNLCAIKRENQVFYCVSEARRKLFSRVSDMALNDWVNFLSVEILNASDEESKILEKQFGTEPGPFLLISESDLIRLFNVNRSPFTGTLFPFPSHVCTAVPDSLRQNSNESTSTIDSRNDNLVHSVNTVTSPRSKSQGYTVGSPRADQCANQTLQRVQTPAKNETVSIGDPFFPGREENSEIAASATENCKTQPKPDQDGTETRRNTGHFNAGESEENTDSQGLSQEKNRSDQRKSHVLTDSEMTPQLRSDMKKVRRFFSQELNLNRQGGPLQPSTLNKIIERVAGFLWYVICQGSRARALSLWQPKFSSRVYTVRH